jgi:hypothetical protein
VWFRRRRKGTRRLKPFDEASLPTSEQATLEEATDEGLMLAEYATRMAVRNQIVIGALTDEASYDPARYAAVAREALASLENEAAQAAERLADERRWASTTVGEPEHIHDYRSADDVNLEHRERLSIAMADRLRKWAADDERVAALVESARQDAWREVGSAIQESLVRAWIPVDDAYRREREKRMQLLVTEDLPELMIAPRE